MCTKDQWVVVFIAYVAFLLVCFVIIMVIGIPKLLPHKIMSKMVLAYVILCILLICPRLFYSIQLCFCGRQHADESRENITRQPGDVEQPQITVQFESGVRAQRQPYRSTSSFEVRALPPVRTFIGECAICMEEFKNGDTIQPFGVCTHEFHSSCIQPWFDTGKTTCPLCREDLSTSLKTKKHMDRIRI